MENRAHALIAGLFAIVLGIGVLVAIWWLSGNREATREVLLVTQRSVSGLNPQAQVRYRGVRCGKVQEIYLDPVDANTIIVRVSIRRDIPLTTATTAELKPQGITGLSFIELGAPQAGGAVLPALPMAPPGDLPRIALKPSMVDIVGEDVGATLANVRTLAARIMQVVSDRNLEKLNATLHNVETVTGNLAVTSEQMPQVVTQLRAAVSPENVERISKLIAHLEKTGRDAAPVVADLRALVNSAKGAVERIDAVTSNTATTIEQNTLPRVDALIQDVAQTTRQAARVAEKLEAEPQSIIFGPQAPRPGPGEPGFVAPPAR